MSGVDMQSSTDMSAPHPSFLRRHWQKLMALSIWVLLLGCYFWYSATYNVGLIQLLLQLIDLMRTSVYGPLIYIVIYAIRPFTFFSAGILTVAGGFLFGPIWGVPYTLIAGSLSATVAYFIGRYFGASLLDDSSSTGMVARYASRLRQDSFMTVLIMRLVLLPYDFVNYLCGILGIRYRAYIIASVIGSVPGTIAFVLFGASVKDIDKLLLDGEFPSLDLRVLGASAVIFVLSIALSRYFKKQEKS